MNVLRRIAKLYRKIKRSCCFEKTIIFRRQCGICTKVDSKEAAPSIEHMIYNNSSELSNEDLINLEVIISKEGAKNVLRQVNRANYRMFAIKLNGELAHFCLVVTCKKGGFFGLAHEGDIMITGCNTIEKHRRKGLYKANLDHICSNWHSSKQAYINTRPVNIISQKGLQAAGFERMGTYSFFRIGRLTARVRKCGN